jgi:hypothetical protein
VNRHGWSQTPQHLTQKHLTLKHLTRNRTQPSELWQIQPTHTPYFSKLGCPEPLPPLWHCPRDTELQVCPQWAPHSLSAPHLTPPTGNQPPLPQDPVLPKDPTPLALTHPQLEPGTTQQLTQQFPKTSCWKSADKAQGESRGGNVYPCTVEEHQHK